MTETTIAGLFTKRQNRNTSAENLILTRPLENFHIDTVKHEFNLYCHSGYWKGFAVLDNVPPVLNGHVKATKDMQIGVVLFCDKIESTYFLFLDLNSNFRIVNSHGVTLLMGEELSTLLKRFHQMTIH